MGRHRSCADVRGKYCERSSHGLSQSHTKMKKMQVKLTKTGIEKSHCASDNALKNFRVIRCDLNFLY